MSHDTVKDPRLLAAQLACAQLTKLGVRPKMSKQAIQDNLKLVEANLMACKLMYLPPDQLAEQPPLVQATEACVAIRRSIEDIFAKRDAPLSTKAWLRWCFRTLEGGLPDRLRRGGETLASGVDLKAVKVGNVSKKGKLWLTRVDESGGEVTVVTNMPGINPGQILGAAFLRRWSSPVR